MRELRVQPPTVVRSKKGDLVMEIQFDDRIDLAIQSPASGLSSVDHYVQLWLDRDRERLSIQEGIDGV
jgi:hypothetical protein